MRLIWKLLRRHISLPQFAGFFFANMLGMLIVLFTFQFYNDVLPIFTQGDSFMKSDYLVVSKRIGAASALSGRSNGFSQSEIAGLAGQESVKTVAAFTSASYRVDATISVAGVDILRSELFFESIPDDFIDMPLDKWKYRPGDKLVPIILPRSYLTMYNFGFAQSRSLPKISEGLVGMLELTLFVDANGHSDRFRGQVIGFSGRLNSILVPQSFMDWSNARYSTEPAGQPTRLILDVGNPSNGRITEYMEERGYDVSDNNLAAEKTTCFLRILVFIVVAIGLVISALSFYMLMLSIYLLVQKNASKLENLLLIGYPPSRVALPYQSLVALLNLSVLVIVLVVLSVVRPVYMELLQELFPGMGDGSVACTFMLGIVLFLSISLVNAVVIRRKVDAIWQRKD